MRAFTRVCVCVCVCVMQAVLPSMTMELICRVCFGPAATPHTVKEFRTAFDDAIAARVQSYEGPPAPSPLAFIRRLFSPRAARDQAFWTAVGRVYRTLEELIERAERDSGAVTVVRILRAKGWSVEKVRDTCLILVLAGFDDVAAAIGWSLYHLANGPFERDRLVEELAEQCG